MCGGDEGVKGWGCVRGWWDVGCEEERRDPFCINTLTT